MTSKQSANWIEKRPSVLVIVWGALAIVAGIVAPVTAWIPPLFGPSAPLEANLPVLRVLFSATGAALCVIGFYTYRRGIDHPARPGQDEFTKRSIIGLSVLLCLGAVLRVVNLNSCLWYDEVVTLVEFVRSPLVELVTMYPSTNNHILYSLLSHVSVACFGEYPWVVRLPAFLFGVGSLAALWMVGSEVTNRRETWLATLLVCVSYHHIWFSQNARGYTGILFCGLMGTALFLRGTRQGASTVWLPYALVFAAAMYFHLSAVFLFLAHALIWGGMGILNDRIASTTGDPQGPCRRSDGWQFVAFLVGSLAIIQLYFLLVPQMVHTFGIQASAGSGSATVGEWKNPLWTAIEFLRTLQLGPLTWLVGICGLGIGAIGLWNYFRRDPWVAVLMVLPSVLALGVLLALSFNIWPRYFLVSIGFVALIVIRGISVVGRWMMAHWPAARRIGGGRDAIGNAFALVLILASCGTLIRNYQMPKQDYVGARDFIESKQDGNSIVLTAGLVTYPYANFYAPKWKAVESVSDLDAFESKYDTVWVVFSFTRYLKAVYPNLFERIDDSYRLVRTFPGSLGDGTMFVYRKESRL